MTLLLAAGIFSTVLALRFVVWLAVAIANPNRVARARAAAGRKAGQARSIIGDASSAFSAVALRALLALRSARRRLEPVARKFAHESGTIAVAAGRGISTSSGRMATQARERLPVAGRKTATGGRAALLAFGRGMRAVPGTVRHAGAVVRPYVLACLAAVGLVVLAVAWGAASVLGRKPEDTVVDGRANGTKRDSGDEPRRRSDPSAGYTDLTREKRAREAAKPLSSAGLDLRRGDSAG